MESVYTTEVENLTIGNQELEGLYELWAALPEERRMIVASVKWFRSTRRRKGSFVFGDGADSGPRFSALQQQIDSIEGVIAPLTRDETEEMPPALSGAAERIWG